MEPLNEILAKVKSGEMDSNKAKDKVMSVLCNGDDPQARTREMAKREADRAFSLGIYDNPSILENYRLLRTQGDATGFITQVSGLQGLESKTFATFKKRPKFPEVEKALQAAKEFSQVGRNPVILTLAGGVGVGKSHLLMAIGWELAMKGVLVFYRPQLQLESELKQAMNERRYEVMLNDILDCPFLLLDDFGIHKMSEWSIGIWDAIIDHRWSRRLPLAVSTNLRSQELPPRMADRLADKSVARVVQISAESYRKTGGKQ